MSKNAYYEDVKIIKKPLKKRFKNLFIFFICIITVIGVVFSSIYLSDALSVGNISSTLIFGGTKININKHLYFAVTLGEYSEESKAYEVATGSTIQGASGFIWYDKNYFVIGNIYKSYKDAESVLKNLSDSNYDVNIKEIIIPKIELNFQEIDNKDVAKIREAFNFIDDLYNSLYNFSISFDKGESNNFAISSEISSLRGDCKVHISNIQNYINKGVDLQKIQDALLKIDELLNQTILKTIDNSSTNYSLKYAISSIIKIKYDLYNNL